MSPLYNVKGKMPPTLILEGKTDHVTPLDGVEQFHKKIKSFNSYSELHVFQNVGHMFTPSNLDDTGWPQPDKDVQKEAQEKKDAFLLKLGYLNTLQLNAKTSRPIDLKMSRI
ncbi:MAG: dienelactone hydrolase family protein [Calditrichaceae bacterium]